LLASKPGQRSGPALSDGRPLWGVINLGDEPTSLVFDHMLGQELRMRLLLEPGEGCRLPTSGLRVAGYTLDKREPDVLLLVRHRQEADERS
jgi:hypothetical protein